MEPDHPREFWSSNMEPDHPCSFRSIRYVIYRVPLTCLVSLSLVVAYVAENAGSPSRLRNPPGTHRGTRGEPGQADALREAGFILGTAYQLGDDVLDAAGNEEVSGKSLGSDDQRGKTTAITATKNATTDPVNYIYSLLETSSAQLAAWPELQGAWDAFLDLSMKPILTKHLTA